MVESWPTIFYNIFYKWGNISARIGQNWSMGNTETRRNNGCVQQQWNGTKEEPKDPSLGDMDISVSRDQCSSWYRPGLANSVGSGRFSCSLVQARAIDGAHTCQKNEEEQWKSGLERSVEQRKSPRNSPRSVYYTDLEWVKTTNVLCRSRLLGFNEPLTRLDFTYEIFFIKKP